MLALNIKIYGYLRKPKSWGNQQEYCFPVYKIGPLNFKLKWIKERDPFIQMFSVDEYSLSIRLDKLAVTLQKRKRKLVYISFADVINFELFSRAYNFCVRALLC